MMNLDINGTLLDDSEDNVQINTIDSYNSRVIAYANSVEVNGVTVWARDNSPTSPPEAPTDLAASDGTSADSIEIQWMHAVSSSVVFNLYRDDILLKEVSNTSTTDATATAEVEYSYHVEAIYIEYPELGASPISNVDTGYRGTASLPGQIHNLLASDGSYTDKVELIWDEDIDSSSYEIARDVQGSIILSPTSSGVMDTSATPGIKHTYWVRGVNSSGYGAWSIYDFGHAGVLPEELPGAINNFVASDTLDDSIICTWTNGAGTDTTDIYIDGALLANNVTSPYTYFTDPRTSSFYVIAKNSKGQITSNSDNGTCISAEAPSYISNFSASDGTLVGQVQCTWSPATETIYYEIWSERTNGAGNWEKLTSNSQSGDIVVASTATTRYKVRAVGDGGLTDSNTDEGYSRGNIGSSPLIITSSEYITAGEDFPANTVISVCLCGGGGGGGTGLYYDAAYQSGGGGGGGGSGAVNLSLNLPNGELVYATVGNGGAGGTGESATGTDGGTSHFGDHGSSAGGKAGAYTTGGAGSNGGGTGGTGVYWLAGEDGTGASGCGGSFSGGVGGTPDPIFFASGGGGGGAGGFGHGGKGAATDVIGTAGGIGAGGGGMSSHLGGGTAYSGGSGQIVVSWDDGTRSPPS